MLRLALLLLFVSPVAAEESLLKNANLEDGGKGNAPAHWIFPEVCAKDGYEITLSDDQPSEGKLHAVLKRKPGTDPKGIGNLMQVLDAKPFRGKRVRFRAAVRAEVSGEGNQAQLWLRVDRPNMQQGFFDNMMDRPITSNRWKHYDIVGDVDDDATHIYVGLILIGSGAVMLDDCCFEVVDKSVKLTGHAARPKPSPGLVEVRQAMDVTVQGNTNSATFLFPLPLAYRDQVPLTFRLQVDPPEAGKHVELLEGPGPNRVLRLQLGDLMNHPKLKVAYQSLVLVRPTSFDTLPKAAKYPSEWPPEVRPWLDATWCCDFQHERIKDICTQIRGKHDDVLSVIREVLTRSQEIFGKAQGRVNNLTAIEALDKQGSCTSCANLVAALLRGSGIPARILAGYPLWSGPLQTHYIVEAWVPGYGWYPVESTMGHAGWPNHQQINVSIVPIEHEHEAKAKQRGQAAGAVPYMTLTERPDDDKGLVYSVGTLGKYCDHEARMHRALNGTSAEWNTAFDAATPRWSKWLKSKPSIVGGRVNFGPEAIQSESLSKILAECDPVNTSIKPEFNIKDLGKLPKGWKAEKTGSGEGSVWKIVADDSVPSKTGCALAQTAEGPTQLFNICVFDASYKDLEIRVKLKPVAGKIDQGGGVVWRYKDADNYYICRYNPLEENFRVYRVLKGKRVQLGTKESITSQPGKWHEITILQVGNRIQCSLNDVKLLEVLDDTFNDAGKIGFWTKADAVTHFDQLIVTAK